MNFRLLLLVAGFLVLLAGAGALLFVQPGRRAAVDHRNPDHAVSQQPVTGPEQEPVVSAFEPGRAEATTALETLLALYVRAESDRVPVWDEAQYREIRSIGARGDALFADRLFSEAAAAYRRAADGVQELLNSRDEVYAAALAKGREALDRGDGRKAAEQFDRALAVDPTSGEAQAGAARAASLDTVLRLLGEAQALEEAGQLDEARARLTELVAADPHYADGSRALDRVEEKITRRSFDEAMSRFYEAITAGRLTAARTAFTRLQAIDRTDDRVIQAGLLLAGKEEATRIAALRQTAERQSGAEQWREALATYERILALAPAAVFAVSGRSLAAERADLDAALTDAIERPERLQDPALRSGAADLLAYARGVAEPGQRLSSQIDRLQHLLARAETPVAITLLSDNATDVTIYHVGRLGSFVSRQIELTPGTYTVVGSRQGYRDIRKTIEISPEGDRATVVIQCREPI